MQKDLQHPTYKNFKAGIEFSKLKSLSKDAAYVSTDGKLSFHPDIVENNPDWFKEVVDKDVYINLPSGIAYFLSIYGNCVVYNQSKYYNLPFWYKVIKDDTVIMYTAEQFNELPASKLFEGLVDKKTL